MPSASITSTVNGAGPVINASRDDLTVGDVVGVTSTNAHATYAWTLAYKPEGSSAVFSGSAAAASPGNFTVDLEGSYLVRLTADLGLVTESTQYVRLRYLTVLGELPLIAAGEGYGGAIPIPVDQTPAGWTNALNESLLTLLGLVGRVSTSGRVLSVDVTEGYGDHTTVQAAIDAAVAAGAGPDTPYVVCVRPGLYSEDVTFKPHVYVVGDPGVPADMIGFPTTYVRGSHTVDVPDVADVVLIAGMTLANINPSTDASVLKTGSGSVTFYQCVLTQNGLGASQGPALQVEEGTTLVVECQVDAVSALADDRAAITQPSASTLQLWRSNVAGPTGLLLNTSGDDGVVTSLRETTVSGSGLTGYGIVSDATALQIEGGRVASSNLTVMTIHLGGGAFAHSQDVILRNVTVLGDVEFDTTGILGTTSLLLGAVQVGALVFPGGDPSIRLATTSGESLFYDNTTSGMAAENVQEALDELYGEAVLVRTLDDAYDGGVPASGSGRAIVADQGAVRISDAPVASDPPEAGATNGRLEVVSSIRVGAIDFPEISLDPNPYGSGAMVLLGNRVVPNNNPWGAGTTTVMARSTGSPLFRNYNLRVQTESSSGGGAIGRIVLQGGDGLPNGATTPDASSVFVQAGSAFDATATPGNLYLSPGFKTGGTSGSLILVGPGGSTAATLTAAGACTDPVGVTGSITFGTNMGAVTLAVDAADSLATVVANLDALDGISAAEAGGIITLTTDHLGATAEIYFLSATAGVDAALGGFDGVPQVDGTYGEWVDVDVTAHQEISFGGTGATGPLIYNADTGKLTVPGVIDPTAIIFEAAPPPTTGATEGALFTSDGSNGLVVGALYYRGPSNASVAPLVSSATAAGGDLGGTYPNPSVAKVAGVTPGAGGLAVLDDASTSAVLATIGGQPLDATLTALAGLATGANKVPYSTGTDTFGQYDIGTTSAASTVPVASPEGLLDTWVTGGGDAYGDGSDGTAVLSGNTTTLTRDTYYTNLTVASDGILETAGFRLYVSGTLTVAAGGIIHDDGVAASGTTGGTALLARGTLGVDSGGGGNGRSTTGTGSLGTTPTVSIWHNMGSTFTGGSGGTAGGQGGGSGAATPVRPATAGNIRLWDHAVVGASRASTGSWLGGGGGGGGGAGGANIGTGTASSGGGGGGGGGVVVVCRVLSNAGRITARGGNGGNASASGNGAAGGGGGGAGGWVAICAGRVLNVGTVDALGGSGGSGAGGGAAGGDGVTGYAQVLVRGA